MQATTVMDSDARLQVQTAYAGGSWAGAGAIGSTAARADTVHAVAYADGATYLTLSAGNASGFFPAYTVHPSDVLLRYTYMGDADLSGQVNLSDYALIDAGFLLGSFDGVTRPAVWTDGDFDYNAIVNYRDYALIDAAFAHKSGPLAQEMISAHSAQFGSAYEQALAAATTAAPEPATLSLIAAGAVSLLRRKRIQR